MEKKQVALDVADFLDSPEALELTSGARLDGTDVRKIAEIFISICYDGVGKKPRFLDGHDIHAIVGHLMPSRLKRADPLAQHVPDVLRAYLTHLENTQTVAEMFEMRRGLEGTIDEFLETVRTGENAHRHAPRVDPFVHGATKLGRNDPCSCGSGKKFKKCHGKQA